MSSVSPVYVGGLETVSGAGPSDVTCPLVLPTATNATRLSPLIEKHEMALLMLAGFAGFSLMIGLGYNALRRYVFKDFHSLDIVFDAGGKVSLSLTAVTVTSQLLWPADFLQSPTLASKVGVGGTLWYALAIVMSILVFPVLCIQLKTRAPGAKTFPQIAYARFGRVPHLLFCGVALFTNMVIISNLILAGKAAAQVLAKEYSNEFIVLILAVLFGSYCLVGGLGTTFYISYFTSAVIFITASLFILKFTYLAEPEVAEVTSPESFYAAMSCLKGPEGNLNESFLTFRTESGLIYAIVTLFMSVAIVFCDQANWQSRIAAKPKEGITGFFLAAFLWFSIPTSISFVNSITYKSLSFRNGTNLLTDEQIDEGYITPFVIQTLLGRDGCFMLLTLMSMTLMSTGSGEVMSISSILVYDILKTHVRPFRPSLRPTDCPLCKKSKVPLSRDTVTLGDLCACPSAVDCRACRDDKMLALSGKPTFNLRYTCDIHGEYRHYEDQLIRYKTWCMVCVVALIVPFGLLIIDSGMNLNWAFLAAQVFIAPFLVPLYMTIAWVDATASGLVSGGIIGLVAAITGMFTYATTYEGGLSKFYVNTAQDWSILTGLLAGTITSTAVAVAVSLLTGCCRKGYEKNIHISSNGCTQSRTKRVSKTEPITEEEEVVALNTYYTSREHDNNDKAEEAVFKPLPDHTNDDDDDVDISNTDAEEAALKASAEHDYKDDCGVDRSVNKEDEATTLNTSEDHEEEEEDIMDNVEWLKTMSIDNPLNPYRSLYQKELESIKAGRILTSKHMAKIFRNIRLVSLTGAAVSFVVFLIIIPAVALTQEVLTEDQLRMWISCCQHWCLVGTVFVVVVPPVQEGIQVWRQWRSNKRQEAGEVKC